MTAPRYGTRRQCLPAQACGFFPGNSGRNFFFHGIDGTHAAINLVGSALVKNGFAGAFLRSRKQGTNHYGVRANNKRFHNVARKLDAAIRYAAAIHFPWQRGWNP